MWNNCDKSIAIRQLVINLGDVPGTIEQTGVPVRTHQCWKNEI